MNGAWQGICRAGLIIADLTGGNPNVTYEIGLADCLGKEIILLSQTTKVSFDFVGQRLIIYDNTVNGARQLEKRLKQSVESYAKGV